MGKEKKTRKNKQAENKSKGDGGINNVPSPSNAEHNQRIEQFHNYEDIWRNEANPQAIDLMLNCKAKQFRKKFKKQENDFLSLNDKKKFPILNQKYKNKRLNEKIDLIQKKLIKQPSVKETRGIHELLDYFPRDTDIHHNFFNQEPFEDVLSILKADLGFKIKRDEISSLFKPQSDLKSIKTKKFDFDVDKVNLLLYDLEYAEERVGTHNRLANEIEGIVKSLSSNILHKNAKLALNNVRSLKATLDSNFQLELNYQKNLVEFSKVYADKLETDFIAVRTKERVKILFNEFFDYLWDVRQRLIEKETKIRKRLSSLGVFKLYGKQLTHGYLLDNNYKYNKEYDETVDLMNEGLADVKLGMELNEDANQLFSLSRNMKDLKSFRAFNSDQPQMVDHLMSRNGQLRHNLLKNNAFSVLDDYKFVKKTYESDRKTAG